MPLRPDEEEKLSEFDWDNSDVVRVWKTEAGSIFVIAEYKPTKENGELP